MSTSGGISSVRGSAPTVQSVPHGPLFGPDEWRQLVERFALPERQQEVAWLILSGCGDKQIASMLRMSLPTVRSHVSRLFQRIGVKNRQEVILKIFFEFLDMGFRLPAPGCPAASDPGGQPV